MCVGTSCVWVIRWRSMAASSSSGSKCSITTAVPPRRWVPTVQPAGAAWYSGAGLRYTVSLVKPNRPPSICVRNDSAPSVARRQRRQDALRLAGGAGRVEHPAALALVGHAVRRRRRRRRSSRRSKPGRSPSTEMRVRHVVEVVAHRGDDVGQAGRGDQRGGVAVAHDVAGLGGGEVPVDRRDVEPGAHGRPHDVVELGLVVEQHGEVVAALQAPLAQHVGESGRRLVDLAVRPGLAGAVP